MRPDQHQIQALGLPTRTLNPMKTRNALNPERYTRNPKTEANDAGAPNPDAETDPFRRACDQGLRVENEGFLEVLSGFRASGLRV